MRMKAKGAENKPKKKIPARGNGSSLVAFQKFLKENKNPTPSYEPKATVLSSDEVSKHNTPSDCWTIYKGHVYNITPFLEYHPGGVEELLRGAGKDCTQLYDRYHPWVNADAVMGKLKLGPLVGSEPRALTPSLKIQQAPQNSENTRDNRVSGDSNAASHSRLTIKVSTDSEPSSNRSISCVHLLNQPIGIFGLFNAVKHRPN